MDSQSLFAAELEELRVRRENEEKLTRLHFALTSFVFTVLNALIQMFSAKPLLALISGVLSAGFLVGVGVRLCDKIRRENEVYRGISRTIVNLLSNHFAFKRDGSAKPFIGDEIENMGTGKGHEATIEIVKFTASFSALAILILSIANFLIKR